MEYSEMSEYGVKSISEDDKYCYFEGYASYYDNIDSDYEIVRKGAFSKSLKGSKSSNVKLHLEHKHDFQVGHIDELIDTDKGLLARGRVLKIKETETPIALMKEGFLGLSVGYNINKQKRAIVKGMPVRELHDLTLNEISIVKRPANKNARFLQVKSMSHNYNDALLDMLLSVSIVNCL